MVIGMEKTGWILMHDYGYEGLAIVKADYNYSHYDDECPPKVYTDKAEAEARRDHLSKIWGSDGEITLIEVAL